MAYVNVILNAKYRKTRNDKTQIMIFTEQKQSRVFFHNESVRPDCLPFTCHQHLRLPKNEPS